MNNLIEEIELEGANTALIQVMKDMDDDSFDHLISDPNASEALNSMEVCVHH